MICSAVFVGEWSGCDWDCLCGGHLRRRGKNKIRMFHDLVSLSSSRERKKNLESFIWNENVLLIAVFVRVRVALALVLANEKMKERMVQWKFPRVKYQSAASNSIRARRHIPIFHQGSRDRFDKNYHSSVQIQISVVSCLIPCSCKTSLDQLNYHIQRSVWDFHDKETCLLPHKLLGASATRGAGRAWGAVPRSPPHFRT